jgi:hypothetical protein
MAKIALRSMIDPCELGQPGIVIRPSMSLTDLVSLTVSHPVLQGAVPCV